MLTFGIGCGIIIKRLWRGVRVAEGAGLEIQCLRKGPWVRIPPFPFQQFNIFGTAQCLVSTASSEHGDVPKWLKGLPWKGSRSLIAAQEFKSLHLRHKSRKRKSSGFCFVII